MAGTLGIEPSANSPIFQARGNGRHGGIRLRIRLRTEWDNWADIERTNPGMAALVLPHVNVPQAGICKGQGGLGHRFPGARKCEDASVRIVPHVSVEEEATWNLPNGRTHAV